MEDEVLFAEANGWGIITLNRPKALNALTWNMCRLMLARLTKWASEEGIKAVLIKGAGEKAFCAGGDIRWLYDQSKTDPQGTAEFFRTEYNLDSLIHHFPKPFVALMHGVVMGGGVGVSISGSTRIVGKNIIWAMPETGIGMVPDVGGSYFLPRLEGGLGPYLGLTGHRLDGAAAVYAGIATHLVPEDRFGMLEEALTNIASNNLVQSDIDACVGDFHVAQETPLKDIRGEIDQYFFGLACVEVLMGQLAGNNSGFAQQTLKKLKSMSPISLKLSLEEINRGGALSFDQCVKMEFGIVRKIMEGPDFHEGVRAQIIDKDRNPAWSPDTLGAVDEDLLAPYFADLGDLALQIEHGYHRN